MQLQRKNCTFIAVIHEEKLFWMGATKDIGTDRIQLTNKKHKND